MPVKSIKVSPKLEKLILDAVNTRERFSRNEMAQKYADWDAIDREFTFFVPETEADNKRRRARDDGNPQYTNIHVPYTYSLALAAHTYISTVFLSRSPVLQFQGNHGEGENAVLALEALMGYQNVKAQHNPEYYVWMMDGIKYSMGVLWNWWEVREYAKTTYEEVPKTDEFGVEIDGEVETERRVRILKEYEGNSLCTVRPKDYIPDPRVQLSNPHRGEFVGRRVRMAWNDFKRGKRQGYYFNLDKLQRLMKKGDTGEKIGEGLREEGQSQAEINELPSVGHSNESAQMHGTVPCVEMVIEIIPKDWGLSQLDFPERWIFSVAKDQVVYQASPYGAPHNKFPVEILESEIDGHTLAKRSLLEVGQPLNNVLNWLVNSHFYAVRRSLNGEFVYDPTAVRMSDVLDPQPGKRIPLRPQAQGRDVRTAITAIQGGADVTGTHMQDTRLITEMLNRATGINENLMGALNPGGRKTATEVRGAQSSSVNRLRTLSEYWSETAFGPNAVKMTQNTQEYYDDELVFRIAGDQIENPQEFMKVLRDDIAGSYNFVPVDGTLPVDRLAIVSMWTQLIQQASRMPQLMQEMDITRLFMWVAQQGGLKNVKQFRINTGDTQGVLDQAQRGNLVPVGGGPEAGGSGRATDRAGVRPPVAGGASGVGPVG